MAAHLGNNYGKRFSTTNQPHIKGGRKTSRISALIKVFAMEDGSRELIAQGVDEHRRKYYKIYYKEES